MLLSVPLSLGDVDGIAWCKSQDFAGEIGTGTTRRILGFAPLQCILADCPGYR